MPKILLILFILSCYEKNIQRLSNLFKRGNTSIDNRIIYKVERSILVNNLYKFNANLTYIKDLNKDKLFIKDENEKTLLILENKKLIFKESNIVLQASNSTTELIYNIFLYSSLELDKVLNILNIKQYEKSNLSPNLIKVLFKDGYLVYDTSNRTVKELSNIMYDNNVRFDNKLYFDYKIVSRMLILNKFRLESKSGNNILIAEEEVK